MTPSPWDINAQALAYLREQVGPGTPPRMPRWPTRTPPFQPAACPCIRWSIPCAATRLNSLGQSLPDWLQRRFWVVEAVCDGVVYPESEEQVQSLLATHCGAAVIPVGGATSVVGTSRCARAATGFVCINMTRMGQLLHLDAQAQLATFGAGVLGPDLEAQLRAQGFTLGTFRSRLNIPAGRMGGTRSSGQQSRCVTGAWSSCLPGRHAHAGRGAGPAHVSGLRRRAGPARVGAGLRGRMGCSRWPPCVTALPRTRSFMPCSFPDWERAQAAVQALAQATLPLSMLRLSNPWDPKPPSPWRGMRV